MKEFKVNEYLTLKLINNKTNIYIAGKNFRQCKFLLLDIPVKKVSTFDELQSIDEAAERLDRSMEGNRSKFNIPPETEFWGHCSNLQVWAEHDYDTRLLHRTLAFPLLKELADAGDPKAEEAFKREIISRFLSNHKTVIQYLLKNHYLDYLNEMDRKELVRATIEKGLILLLYYLLNRTNLKNVLPQGPGAYILSPFINREELRTKLLFWKSIIEVFNQRNFELIEFILKNEFCEVMPAEMRGAMFIDANPELKKNMLEDFETYKKNYEYDSKIKQDVDILRKLIKWGDQYAESFLQECLLTPFKTGNLDAIMFILKNEFYEVLPVERRVEMFIEANLKLKKKILNDLENSGGDYYIRRDIGILRQLISWGDKSAQSLLHISILTPFKAGNLTAINFILKNEIYEVLPAERRGEMFIDANPNLKKNILEDFKTHKNYYYIEDKIKRDIDILRQLISWGDESVKSFLQECILTPFKERNLATIYFILKNEFYEVLPAERRGTMFIDANPELKKNMLENFETYENSRDASKIKWDIDILRKLIDLGDESARSFLQECILTPFKAGNLAAIMFIGCNYVHFKGRVS